MSLISSSISSNLNSGLEAYRLIHDPTRLFSLLYSKYGEIEEDFYILYINQLIYNSPTRFNSIFKEIKYHDITNDNLKRIYKKKECINRIPKLSDYYKNYHEFFCRPILRDQKLGLIMSDYEDNKAELFYKNNYKESKGQLSEKDNKDENKDKNDKKNSSFSFSSLDNITNNKIIFDKQTKKMLEKVEKDYNNNYYNTLTLETSKSYFLSSINNNDLITKRSGDESFEKCIHALVMYQYKKNKNKNSLKNTIRNSKIRSAKKSSRKNSRKKKNLIINDINSNFNNNLNYGKQKINTSQSQRESHNKSNINTHSRIQSTFCITKLINNISNRSKITRANSNFNHNNNKLISSKKKKNSLFSLSNNKFITTRTNIINSFNNIIGIKKTKKYVLNNKIKPKLEEFNLNQFLHKNKKSNLNPSTSKKNKTYIFANNNGTNSIGVNSNNNSKNASNIYSNLGVGTNLDIAKNLKFDNNENNYKKFSKLIEYLKQTQNKDKEKKDIRKNFVQKKIIHKKYSVSIGGDYSKNIFFNPNNNSTNLNSRVTKKKITINKNLKIAIANINSINLNINSQKNKQTKNKTFDYNTINHHTSTFLKQNNNKTNITSEEYNTILNKPKKIIYKIKTDLTSLKNNKIISNNNNPHNGENSSKSKKISKNKIPIFSPSSKKMFTKISFIQTESKEKNRKKNLIVKINNPNNKKVESELREKSSPFYKRKNYSMVNTEELIPNNIIIKHSHNNKKKNYKTNYYSNNNINNINNSNLNLKNISVHMSPEGHIHNIVSSTKNSKKKSESKLSQNNNHSYIKKNNIFKKTSVSKNRNILNHKRTNNILISSHNVRKIKEYYSHIYLSSQSNNISKNISDIRILSRNNKKLNSQKNSKNKKAHVNNNTKKNKVINKSNSSLKTNNYTSTQTNHSVLNNNISLNYDGCQNIIKSNNNILLGPENINLSIGENNINIRDSILHINKIYIKNSNCNSHRRNPKISKVYSGNNCCLNLKIRGGTEIKTDDCRGKTGGNNNKKNKENIKPINFPSVKYENSPKVINIKKNINLIPKNNNDIKVKYKKLNLDYKIN